MFSRKSFHFAGDDEFFVGRNHQDFHARIRLLMTASRWRWCDVDSRGIQSDAKLIEVRADGLAEFRAVLADAGGEDDGVRAVQLRQK